MRKRTWRVTAGLTVAIATSIVTVLAGGAQAIASPAAPAAPASLAPVVSDLQVRTSANSNAMEAGVTAFHGFSTFKGIKIESRGVDLDGYITGKLRSYSFESLWTVYNLPKSSGWSLWVVKFKQDQSQSVLKETFRKEELQDIDINMHFSVKADALRNVSYLRLGFETLRLQLDGQTKDFTVVNSASGGAQDQSGNNIPVDFQPV